MEPKNRREFFAFIGQCIAAAFVVPAVMPKVVGAIEPTTGSTYLHKRVSYEDAFIDCALERERFDREHPEHTMRAWYVDPVGGDDANDGLSCDRPMRSIPSNFGTIKNGDTIYFKGYYPATVMA